MAFKSGLTEFSDFPKAQSIHLEEGFKMEKRQNWIALILANRLMEDNRQEKKRTEKEREREE